VGTGGIVPLSVLLGELVPFSDSSFARSIKSPLILLSYIFFPLLLVDGISGSESTLVLMGDGSGMDI
jgi:hypothetical protein